MSVFDERCDQNGFSLFEVLIAMLIAALGIIALMAVHAYNLRQVSDRVKVSRAQVVLSNMAHRVQKHTLGKDLTAQQVQSIKDVIATQALDAGIGHVDLGIKKSPDKIWNVSVKWPAHDGIEAVWRAQCTVLFGQEIPNQHCLAMRVY